MTAELNIDKFEDFIAQYPIFEYRILNTGDLSVEERVRIVCQQECERYGSTWACPPAVGTLKECEERIRKFGQAVFFSSVAEVSDLMNMQEMLQTRAAHEELTTEVARFLKEQGFETFTLSTESCDICEDCAYPHGKPCRHPVRLSSDSLLRSLIRISRALHRFRKRSVCSPYILTRTYPFRNPAYFFIISS